jgi:hypothetical protein
VAIRAIPGVIKRLASVNSVTAETVIGALEREPVGSGSHAKFTRVLENLFLRRLALRRQGQFAIYRPIRVHNGPAHGIELN